MTLPYLGANHLALLHLPCFSHYQLMRLEATFYLLHKEFISLRMFIARHWQCAETFIHIRSFWGWTKPKALLLLHPSGLVAISPCTSKLHLCFHALIFTSKTYSLNRNGFRIIKSDPGLFETIDEFWPIIDSRLFNYQYNIHKQQLGHYYMFFTNIHLKYFYKDINSNLFSNLSIFENTSGYLFP